MRDVTNRLEEYREAVRHLWKIHFRLLEDDLKYGSCLELFEQISERLFQALVCEPLGIENGANRADFEPLSALKVVPNPLGDVRIMINRTAPTTAYWDDPVRSVKASEVELLYIECFDWDVYGLKDLRYYMVRISSFPSKPHLIGRDALIETTYAKVFLA